VTVAGVGLDWVSWTNVLLARRTFKAAGGRRRYL